MPPDGRDKRIAFRLAYDQALRRARRCDHRFADTWCLGILTQLVQKYFEDNGRQENTLYAKTEQKILTDLINAANPLTVDMLKRRYGKVVSKIMLEGEGYKFSIDEQGRATVTTYKLKAGEIAYIKK